MKTQKKQNKKNLLIWFNLFADYVQTVNINIYNEACNYADKNEKN